jgi:hypothetical protein
MAIRVKASRIGPRQSISCAVPSTVPAAGPYLRVIRYHSRQRPVCQTKEGPTALPVPVPRPHGGALLSVATHRGISYTDNPRVIRATRRGGTRECGRGGTDKPRLSVAPGYGRPKAPRPSRARRAAPPPAISRVYEANELSAISMIDISSLLIAWAIASASGRM